MNYKKQGERMMKRLFATILSVLMALLMVTGCGKVEESQDSLERIQSRGKFIVGLDDSFPPLGFRNDKNEIVGFDIDLAREVGKKLGVEVEFQPVVWDNIVQEINTRNVDVIWNGCTITPERQKSFDFSEPYLYNKQVVVVMNDSPYQTLDELADKKAAVQDGSSANVALDNNPEFRDSLGEIVGYAQNDRAMLDLMGGGVDAVIVDAVVLAYYDQIQPNKFRPLDQDLGAEALGVAFNKEDATFREAVQQALNECQKEGITAELEDKWLAVSTTK